MPHDYSQILGSQTIETSAPCRIDVGGTLDIRIFANTLRAFEPCTFNIAVGLRTRVRLFPYARGRVRISSRGFQDAEFSLERAPFDNPFGLILAIVSYFGVDGIHIDIISSSPPRSALGGSSTAAVAVVAAFYKLFGVEKLPPKKKIALLTHALEESVAGVPCGYQDMLAACHGGVNTWHWKWKFGQPAFKRKVTVKKSGHKELEKHLLLAYCGIPHQSSDINGRWVRQFLKGKNRKRWVEILNCTRAFIDAVGERKYDPAVAMMNRETAIRREMTPEVLDRLGEKLVDQAIRQGCGARFTGAGGGGCIWALGKVENIDRLRPLWEESLSTRQGAGLLDVKIDASGVVVH
jgi:D-glycero-alpha-D-manno-heptose-7-phosphate kinase